MAKRQKEILLNQPLVNLDEAKQQVKSMKLDLIFNKVSPIEKTILKSIATLDINTLNELPDDEDVFYNSNCHRDNLISELEFDFSKIKYNGTLPLDIKTGKCNYCYPNNNTYTFHNPKNNELVIRCVIDKIDDKNYISMVCTNKLKSKLSSPKDGMPF